MSFRPVSCPGCLYSGQPHLENCEKSYFNRLNRPDPRAGLYKQVPCSCICGGDTAWVRITETGAEEMIGCICHTFAKNDSFRRALDHTGYAVLTHSIGKTNPSETILTQREFCSRLMHLRDIGKLP